MKIIATSGIAQAVELELLIPDPPNALEILANATNTGTAEDDTKSD